MAKGPGAGPGRPTDYKPEYCEQVLALMETGLSLTASMASIGFTRQRAHEWAERHPEFRDAIALGQGKRTLKLEMDLMGATLGPVVTARSLALKNSAPDEWREKVTQELTGENGGPVLHRIERVIVRPKDTDR